MTRGACITFSTSVLSLLSFLEFLAPICWVTARTPDSRLHHPPPASTRSDQTGLSPCQSMPCPRRPEKRARHLHQPVGAAELQLGHSWRGTAVTGGWRGLRAREVPRGTYTQPATTAGPYSRSKLGLDVLIEVWGEVLLQVFHEQVHLEVHATPQLDDATDQN